MWRGNHNISECFYHIQLTIKYRRKVLTSNVEETIKNTLQGLNERYDIDITKIGFDKDHVHIMLQHLPTHASSNVIKIIKSITAREVFKHNPDIKEMLWGGNLWTQGYYIATISARGDKTTIINYIKNQGLEKQEENKRIEQLRLFDITS